MSWTEDKALRRIEEMQRTAPVGDIRVEQFEPYFRGRETLAEAARARGAAQEEPIWYVPRNRAVTTHGVHIYANLIDYNDKLVDGDRETEASHERALQFLNLHYGACDQLIAAFNIQRVDFHGSRLHAVVLTPVGPDREVERIEKAITFAAAFREMVLQASARFGAGFQTQVRIGIDSGPAVAVNSGQRTEPEPLFIGSPANHAAKLADGDVEGVFLSPGVQRVWQGGGGEVEVGLGRIEKAAEVGFLERDLQLGAATARVRSRLDEAFSALVAAREEVSKAQAGPSPAAFRFHHREPPLRTIDFRDHPPSNAIRMSLTSIFSDIDGFTAYVDTAIATGQVAQAVANLHVLRGEMAAVLREDYGGRKVRFIGDCLHGLVAEGGSQRTDDQRTVRSAVMVAAALRSSFDLCKQVLPGISSLGLGIGIEHGWTPVCRLGLRGEASVRCSSSRATCVSEAEQRRCGGRETAIGEAAFAAGDVLVKHVFRGDRKAVNLTFSAASSLLTGMSAPQVRRSDPEPMRAHLG
ncbi:MAG: hypothetical protein JWL77_7143 [Chthonomonadaceae bacterium]|nr:hypothetical protein [Chthonomonadaceae bacterium]